MIRSDLQYFFHRIAKAPTSAPISGQVRAALETEIHRQAKTSSRRAGRKADAGCS
jgi:hypothetical protein